MKLIKCTCEHEYQDGKYGKGVRLMNQCFNPNKYRCTVCGKEHRA